MSCGTARLCCAFSAPCTISRTPLPLPTFALNYAHPVDINRQRLRRPRFAPSASQSSSRRPDNLDDAVRSSRNGNFKDAARKLRGQVPPVLIEATDERRSLARDLLNPITLARVAKGSRNGGTELFDDGVRALYEEMAVAGLLPALGAKRRAILAQPGGGTTVEGLVTGSGLPYSALSPTRSRLLLWQFAGIGLVSFTMYATRAIGMGQLGGPIIASFGLLLAADQVALRGSIFETVYSTLAPTFRDRIVHHEAAHFIVAYLCGLQISGYVTSGREALASGIPSLGQGGTIFAFPELSEALQSGQLKARTIDVWSTVLMAGIAAEALTYGQAEGGASDEETLINLLQQLNWDATRVKAQARFGVLQAVLLLREHNQAFSALAKKMRASAPLGDCIDCIEGHFVDSQETLKSPDRKEQASPEPMANCDVDWDGRAARIADKEADILAKLSEIEQQLAEGDKEMPGDS